MNLQQPAIKRGRKFDQVLDGARRVFMADGFERASVDEIAAAAGVSKATLYSYFPAKRMLFTEVLRRECGRLSDRAMTTIDLAAPPEAVLVAAARHLIGFFLSDFCQGMFRICVAEAGRFPELGEDFYASGPMIANEALTGYFRQAIARGELRIDDLPLAAFQFAELSKARLFLRRLLGIQTSFTEAEIACAADSAVSVFLSHYRR